MAVTQVDIDAILAAIVSGTSQVRLADGRMVTYRSVAEMREALSIARGELADDDRTSFAEVSRE